jgi:hypothetical protein
MQDSTLNWARQEYKVDHNLIPGCNQSFNCFHIIKYKHTLDQYINHGFDFDYSSHSCSNYHITHYRNTSLDCNFDST